MDEDCPPEEGHYYTKESGSWVCCKCGHPK